MKEQVTVEQMKKWGKEEKQDKTDNLLKFIKIFKKQFGEEELRKAIGIDDEAKHDK